MTNSMVILKRLFDSWLIVCKLVCNTLVRCSFSKWQEKRTSAGKRKGKGQELAFTKMPESKVNSQSLPGIAEKLLFEHLPDTINCLPLIQPWQNPFWVTASTKRKAEP